MARDSLFIGLVGFWVLLSIFSYFFQEPLTTLDDANINIQDNPEHEETSKYQSIMNGIFDTTETLPILSFFTPLLRLLTFNYTSQVAYPITIILQGMVILSAFVGYSLIRQG